MSKFKVHVYLIHLSLRVINPGLQLNVFKTSGQNVVARSHQVHHMVKMIIKNGNMKSFTNISKLNTSIVGSPHVGSGAQ